MERQIREATGKRKRMANIELLRIVAMMMVVMLHYLSKGHVLPAMTGPLGANGYAAWILETLSIVAVNVYMLISGFFLVESGFKCGRLVQLVCQTLFYSILVWLVLLGTGVTGIGDLTLNRLLYYILPVQMELYWFVTAYVMMYLFSPILSTAVRHMSRKQLKYTVALLLLFLSVGKSVLPVQLELDSKGYDGVWFICVYLTASYLRLYGLDFFDRAKRGFLCYLASCAGILGFTLALRIVYLRTGQLGTVLINTYHYNHILNLFAAVSLFYGFYHWKLPEGGLSRLICRVAPYTLGVYLLHEHIELRDRWPLWLGAGTDGGPALFILRSLCGVAVMFAAGILVDMARGALFAGIGRMLRASRADRLVKKIEEGINHV